MSEKNWLTDQQVQKLNERHGWFKHGDAQSDVSRAFANDAVEAHERLRAAAPEMLEALENAAQQLESGIQLQCGDPDEPPQPASQWDYEAALMAFDLRRLIAKATGEG